MYVYAFHSSDNVSKGDDVVPDTNTEEEFEEQNPDDYKSTVSGQIVSTLNTHVNNLITGSIVK